MTNHAMKIYRPSRDTEEERRRFRREIALMRYIFLDHLMRSLLRHSNLVPCLGADVKASMIAYLMPFYPIGSLRKVIDKLQFNLILEIVRDVCKGLEYLHSVPIIHGDLTLDNIMVRTTLSETSTIQVMDNCIESTH